MTFDLNEPIRHPEEDSVIDLIPILPDFWKTIDKQLVISDDLDEYDRVIRQLPCYEIDQIMKNCYRKDTEFIKIYMRYLGMDTSVLPDSVEEWMNIELKYGMVSTAFLLLRRLEDNFVDNQIVWIDRPLYIYNWDLHNKLGKEPASITKGATDIWTTDNGMLLWWMERMKWDFKITVQMLYKLGEKDD